MADSPSGTIGEGYLFSCYSFKLLAKAHCHKGQILRSLQNLYSVFDIGKLYSFISLGVFPEPELHFWNWPIKNNQEII